MDNWLDDVTLGTKMKEKVSWFYYLFIFDK